jgi:hypothetical protein
VDKVQVGFFSFTEVTDPAEHRSYNAWHQLDHMPEQFPLAGVVYGQRWVATPACRRAWAADGPPLSSVHYVTLYLMGEPLDQTLEQFRDLAVQLRAQGRFHQHRHSHLSGPLALVDARSAPRALVSAEAVPYRPNRGVYVVVRDCPRHQGGAAATAVSDVVSEGSPDGAASGEAELARRLLDVGGVAGVWTFASDARFDHHPWRPGDRVVTVCYLDEDPLAVAAELGALVRDVKAEERAAVVLAGPFETITPWRWDWFDEDTVRA